MSQRSKKPDSKESKLSLAAFNLTPQGGLIRASQNAEQTTFFNNKLLSYGQQLKSMDPDYAYATALGKIQFVLDEVTRHKRKPISCKAGCAACCHQKVDVTELEEARIKQFAADHKLPLDQQHLEVQYQALQRGDGAFEKLTFEARRCIFLDTDQKCRIYPVRPLMCRRHFVQSDPAICRSEDFAGIELDLNPDVDAYLSAYVTKNSTKALPKSMHEHQLLTRATSQSRD